MKKNSILLFLIVSSLGFSQKVKNKKESKASEKYQSLQPQDQSVPPPPNVVFPAQFPEGNRIFLHKVEQNIDKKKITGLGEDLSTQIILKIDQEGNVMNISTFGKDEIFNIEVRNATVQTLENIKWIPGKNNQGQSVIDIVRIPFRIKKES